MPLLTEDGDPLGDRRPRLPQDRRSTRSPEAYEKFQKKEDGAIKFVIQP